MELEMNHSTRDIVTKLLDLFSDISQKGITGPSPNHHDFVNWTLPRYIAIAAPDLWEWVPTCYALKPNPSSTMARTASFRAATIYADVTCSIL